MPTHSSSSILLYELLQHSHQHKRQVSRAVAPAQDVKKEVESEITLLDKSTMLEHFVDALSKAGSPVVRLLPLSNSLMMCIALRAGTRLGPTTKRLRTATRSRPAQHNLQRWAHCNRTALSDATFAAYSSTILVVQASTPAFHRSSSIHPSKWGRDQLGPLRRLHPSCPRPKVESCAISSELSLSIFSYFLVFFFPRERVMSMRHHRSTSPC